jgi:uridine kinase
MSNRIAELVRRDSIAAVDSSGVVRGLYQPAEAGELLEPVMPWYSEGREVYRRSLILALDLAARRAFPDSLLWVEHALSLGYKCRLERRPELSTEAIIEALGESLRSVILEDIPYEHTNLQDSGTDAYPSGRWHDGTSGVSLNALSGGVAFAMGPTVVSTGCLERFDLRPEGAGFVLRFPGSGNWPEIGEWQQRSKLAREFDLEEKHGARLGVRTLDELNGRIESDGGLEVVAMSHFYQEYRLIEIVKTLESSFPVRRIVTIAGPSASGKTTFTRLLGMFLRAQGFGVKSVSVDNYFRNRADTPKDEKGNYDFESLEALETDLFGRHLKSLIDGEEVMLPRFDFASGTRRDGVTPMKLSPNDLLLIEGIHGLNDALTPGVDPSGKHRIYVSALTQLNIDRLTRMSTSDARLLRRMARDSRTRGYSAEQTMEGWPSVRRGERRNIFPFQEMADAVFNSALPYELPVLKPFVVPLLESVRKGTPGYNTALRLLSLMSLVRPIAADVIPRLSLLREFTGGFLLGEA